jgi:hypothetical protein
MKDEITFNIPSCKCPTCGHTGDASHPAETNPDLEAPKAGDLGVCGFCGEVLILDQDLSRRVPTLKELLELDDYDRHVIGKMQEKIRKERPYGK